MIDCEQVTLFLRNHGAEHQRTGDIDSLKAFVAWNILHNQIAVVYFKDGSIAGVGFPRLVNRRKKSHIENPWRVAKEGNALYVTSIAVRHKLVIPRLWDLMVKLFGRRRWFMGRRHGKVKLWTFETYENKLKELYG